MRAASSLTEKKEAHTHDFEVVTAEEIKDDEELQRKWLFSYIQEPNKLCRSQRPLSLEIAKLSECSTFTGILGCDSLTTERWALAWLWLGEAEVSGAL